MAIVRTTDNIDLTQTGDYMAKDSVVDGALKKIDSEIDYLYTWVNYLATAWYSSTEPDSPQAGQLWYDSSVGYYKKYDGATWTAVASGAGISNIVEDTTPELGGNLDLNQFNIVLDSSPTADHTWNGITETLTVGENVVIGDVCYKKSADSKWWKADADAEATAGPIPLRMATATIAANDPGVFLKEGYIRDDTWAWATDGAPLYISNTPGNPTATAPAGNLDVVRIIGYCNGADGVDFCPSTEYTVLTV